MTSEKTFHQFSVRLFDGNAAVVRFPIPITQCDLKRLKYAIDFHVAPSIDPDSNEIFTTSSPRPDNTEKR